MNKTKESLNKNQSKRVCHIILPKKVWQKFDNWKEESGFATHTEAIRFLIRNAAKNNK